MIDVIHLTQNLIRCPSITPYEGGALQVLEEVLTPLGFTCHRLSFEGIENLYARRGIEAPHLCFLGHTDVVPPGDVQQWCHPPFAGSIEEGILYGRGAVDMKGAIAAFISAVSSLPSVFPGSISLLITSDEEGPAVHGTKRVLEWLQERDEIIDFCLGGEPTSVNQVGDMIKIGRRGSLSGLLTVFGTQGHIAYPDHFDNPIPRLMKTLTALYETSFDQGSLHFQPSHFEVTSMDVGNPTSNVIPAQAQARFNIRFNDHHTSQSLTEKIQKICQREAETYKLEFTSSSESFLTSSLKFAQNIQTVLETETQGQTILSTTGGTSDARFIHSVCPVVELGLCHRTAHQIDEQVPLQDLTLLTKLYQKILRHIFKLKG